MKYKVTNQQLRDKVNAWPKFAGAKQIKPDSVINRAYPSCFTLSFGEPPMFEAFGQYLDYSRDLLFTKIQPCVRHQDWPTILSDPKERFRYLSVFDMAGVGGMMMLKDAKRQEEIAKYAIDSLFQFLMSLGLKKDRLRIIYFEETPIKKATAGKYDFGRPFPTDPYVSYWQEKWGLMPKQFIANHNRDTMLALNVFGLPTPWGYRYEVMYDYQGRLVDIGTVEYLNYRPLFDEHGQIKDVVPFNHCFAASVVGMERLLMILNGLDNVWETDTIAPLVDRLFGAADQSVAEATRQEQAMIAAQAWRAIHLIVADGGVYSSLNKRRKAYLRDFYRAYFHALKELGIESGGFTLGLARLNAERQPWTPALGESVELVAAEAAQRLAAFVSDRSLEKYSGRVQYLVHPNSV